MVPLYAINHGVPESEWYAKIAQFVALPNVRQRTDSVVESAEY